MTLFVLTNTCIDTTYLQMLYKQELCTALFMKNLLRCRRGHLKYNFMVKYKIILWLTYFIGNVSCLTDNALNVQTECQIQKYPKASNVSMHARRDDYFLHQNMQTGLQQCMLPEKLIHAKSREGREIQVLTTYRSTACHLSNK